MERREEDGLLFSGRDEGWLLFGGRDERWLLLGSRISRVKFLIQLRTYSKWAFLWHLCLYKNITNK
jgi:hypothetical protein